MGCLWNRVFPWRIFGSVCNGAFIYGKRAMNPEYYIAYTKWMNEFLHKWDYTILAIVVLLLASIGVGTLCYLYSEWLFNRINK